MIYSGVNDGRISTDPSHLEIDDFDDKVSEVLADVPEIDTLSPELRDIMIRAIQKGVMVGMEKSDDEFYPELSLDDFERQLVIRDTMGELGVGVDTAVVTHHDVQRAASAAIEYTILYLQEREF